MFLESVTAQGNTLYVEGPFELGISREVAGTLRSHDIKRVVLDSPGGLLVEGEAIAAKIKQLELDTVVDDRCASACTIAFTAGSDRILKHGGELGFHGASYDGVWVEPTSTSALAVRTGCSGPIFEIEKNSTHPHNPFNYGRFASVPTALEGTLPRANQRE